MEFLPKLLTSTFPVDLVIFCVQDDILDVLLEFFVVNLILSNLAVSCRLGLLN